MPKRTKGEKNSNEPLDTFSAKRPRGRPRKMRASEIYGRAGNYRKVFGYIWTRLREPLLKANSEEEVIQAFQEYGGPYVSHFVPALASLILKVIRDVDFPKRPQAQANFLADSLAARGCVSPRRSRDICERERTKEKHATHIIRYEFYIECSCGYKGRSRDHACPKCKAKIQFWFGSVLNALSNPRFF